MPDSLSAVMTAWGKVERLTHLLGTHQQDELLVLLNTIHSDMDLPVAVGADSRNGVWMVRAAI